MIGKHNQVVFFLVTILIHTGESGVPRDSKQDNATPLSNWKDKLSQVLDKENYELNILHNLLSTSESENEVEGNGKIETPSNPTVNKLTTFKKDLSQKGETVEALREQGILAKLEENSRRMDSMVVFFSDLKNVLSEAINSQTKQMAFEVEVGELREEVENLRKEVQHLKHEHAMLATDNKDHSGHIIHNDEKIIHWLKDSTKEIQNQITEMSKGCNATSLVYIQQQLEQQTKRQQSDLTVVQRQIETIQLRQLQQDERITEAKGDIDDVRSWQTNMGQKFTNGQLNFAEENKVANIIDEEERFLTEALKNFSPKQGRHSKKLKAQLREIQKTTKILAQDHNLLNERLDIMEKSRQFFPKASETNQTPLNDDVEKRLSSLEETVTQYTLSLQNVGDKVNVVNELQESTTQLFTALEDLETRYDEKFTELQTNLIKVETTVSSIDNSNQDMKEQQVFQSGIIQNVKKELQKTKGQLQKNNFRLASLQTEVLKWAAQKCSLEDSQSIQNIRISSLESFLHLLKNKFSN